MPTSQISNLNKWYRKKLKSLSLSFAFLHAVWTPKFCAFKSSPIVLSQVVLGRPAGLLQSDAGRSAAAMTLWWSSSGFNRARCPKNLIRKDLTLSETGKQPVVFWTDSFVEWLVYEIPRIFRRHQVSKASRRLARSWWRSVSRTRRAGLGGCKSCRGAPW